MRLISTLIAVTMGLMSTGCSTVFRGPITHAASPMTLHGPVKFDIANLLSANPTRPDAAADGNIGPLERHVEHGLADFLSRNRTSPNGPAIPTTLEQDRNRVAGALLLASDRNCDVYLENLRGAQSFWRTAFGLAGVGLGAAGAIVTEADTTRLLSGLAGASAGSIGKLDENLMGGMAAEVVVAGVRAGREPIRRDIIVKMQSEYPEWPVEIAIADVLRYHGRCNVMSGLTTAQKAVERESQALSETGTPVTATAAATAAANAAAAEANGAAARATTAAALIQAAQERTANTGPPAAVLPTPGAQTPPSSERTENSAQTPPVP